MSSRAGDRSPCATEVALHSHQIDVHGVLFGIGEKGPDARNRSYTSPEHHLLGP
jgi:hypothetical protein